MFFLQYLTIKDNHWQSSAILWFGLVCNYVLNGAFFCMYSTIVKKSRGYD